MNRMCMIYLADGQHVNNYCIPVVGQKIENPDQIPGALVVRISNCFSISNSPKQVSGHQR